MTVTSVGTVYFDVLMALSPTQRWSAMRQFNVDIPTERAVLLICLLAILILAISFYYVTHKKNKAGISKSDKIFNDYVRACGLNEYQSYLLSELARYMNLEKKDLLFTLADVFERGLQAFTTSHWFMAKDQQNKQLIIEELTLLREKIGFDSESKFLDKTQKMEVSQLGVGQVLFFSHSRTSNSSVIKAKVVKNEGKVLTVRTQEPVAIFSGQNWYVRFSFIDCIWEFEVTVLSCYDDILVLSHDNSVRFASKRHFHAVEVDLPGLLANFPFVKEIVADHAEAGYPEVLEFVEVRVKKVAGPYVSIETNHELVSGSRVVLVFVQASQKKMLQSTAIVKNIKLDDGICYALVELVVSSKTDINELICMSNAAESMSDMIQEQTEINSADTDETIQAVKVGQEN